MMYVHYQDYFFESFPCFKMLQNGGYLAKQGRIIGKQIIEIVLVLQVTQSLDQAPPLAPSLDVSGSVTNVVGHWVPKHK